MNVLILQLNFFFVCYRIFWGAVNQTMFMVYLRIWKFNTRFPKSFASFNKKKSLQESQIHFLCRAYLMIDIGYSPINQQTLIERFSYCIVVQKLLIEDAFYFH